MTQQSQTCAQDAERGIAWKKSSMAASMKEKRHADHVLLCRSLQEKMPRKRLVRSTTLSWQATLNLVLLLLSSSSHFSCSTLLVTPTSFENGRGLIDHQGRNIPAGISLAAAFDLVTSFLNPAHHAFSKSTRRSCKTGRSKQNPRLLFIRT